MSTPPYTEREWNHLIRQGDPEGWQELGGDLASWKPKVERICARHGLSIHGEMQWSSSGATVRCSNTGCLIGDVAVKLFTRRSPIWFLREVESLRVLGDVPRARTPRRLAYGDAISEEDPDHPYRFHRAKASPLQRPWIQRETAFRLGPPDRARVVL